MSAKQFDPETDFTTIDPPERSRSYLYPGSDNCPGYIVAIEGVNRCCMRPSGTHRLETKNGSKYIIQPGWVSLKIDEWSF